MEPTTQLSNCDFRAGALFLIDKPKDWTSFDVVNKLRWAIRKHLGVKKFKVGHSGTLDPMATGLLVLCVGKYTKLLHELQGLDKIYTGTFKLGATTPSYDAETPENQTFEIPVDLNEETIQAILPQFRGPIEQIPPMYSAIKVDGQPLYKKARQGVVLDLPARKVTIHELELLQMNKPEVDFLCHCSKGTYIRSLAHDIGASLNNGAYLTALERTAVGTFQLKDAWNLEALVEAIQALPKSALQ